MINLQIDDQGTIWQSDETWLDSWHWRWMPSDAQGASGSKGARQTIDGLEAVRHVYAQKNTRKIPVGIIGPNEPDADMLKAAELLGAKLAELNVPILCGGRGGVMEAASRGAFLQGGLTMGFLRGDDWRDANDYITIPLATGIGHARNALIAQGSQALVAVGGQYGTHSEAAFGLVFGKQVFGLCHAPDIDGVQHKESVEAVLEALVPVLLHLPASTKSDAS
nr:DNA-binding protein [uncultured Cohaesibacter sp.]